MADIAPGIPSAIRVPLFYAYIDPSRANTGQGGIQRTLIIGQITSAGIAPANVPLLSQGVADAITQGGPGSMLARLTAKYRENDSAGEVWYLPLADNGAGVAAAGSVLITAAPTVNGSLNLGIGEDLVSIPVTSTMTAANIATALSAAINAWSGTDDAGNPISLTVTATVASATVTITARNAGLAGNDAILALNPGGVAAGQQSPTGLAATITQLTGGTLNPVLTTALANLQEMPFDFIVLPYFDSVSLAAMKAFMNDSVGRWSYEQQVYGHTWAAANGNLSALQTLGAANNDQHLSIMGEYQMPTPHWMLAAAYCGAAAASIKGDPGLPVQTLGINGVTAPPIASQFNFTSRNTLLFTGISTFTSNPDGSVAIENVITTYQTNAFGSPDDSYLEVETMYQLMFLLRDLKSDITTKFGRCKLVADMSMVAPGTTNVVSPAVIRSEMIAHYNQLCVDGYAQNAAGFAAGLVVQQNTQNPNRVDVLWDGTIMDQLRVFGVQFQFQQ